MASVYRDTDLISAVEWPREGSEQMIEHYRESFARIASEAQREGSGVISTSIQGS